MMGRGAFLKRAAGQLGALAVLDTEELLAWHDDRIADDFYDQLGDEHGLKGYPVDFEILGMSGRSAWNRRPHRTDRILDSVVKGWDSGEDVPTEVQGRVVRRFVVVICAIESISVSRVRYRVRDGGLIEAAGWKDDPFPLVNIRAGENLQATVDIGIGGWS